MATTFEAERLREDALEDWEPLVELKPRTTELAPIIDLSHGAPVDVEATLNDLYAAIDTAAARMGRHHPGSDPANRPAGSGRAGL